MQFSRDTQKQYARRRGIHLVRFWYACFLDSSIHGLTFKQTTCGADGKVIVWDVSGSEPKEEKVIDGIIPAVVDSE